MSGSPAEPRSTRSTPAIRPHLGRWGATLAATAVSWGALDAVATASGALLVASAPLEGAGHELLIGLLAVTYVAWGAGMRVNLPANARLLESTGTSTRATSKAAHDLACRVSTSRRVRRFAAATGYVAVEAVMEAAYYAGAFGTAALSDGIDAHDALIFLAGANLGAALFEYGIGRGTLIFLDRRPATPRSPRHAA